MTWADLLAKVNYTPENVLNTGFVFIRFPEMFPEISICENTDYFGVEDQLLSNDIELIGDIRNRYVPSKIQTMLEFIPDVDYEQLQGFLLSMINRYHYPKWVKIYKNFLWEYDHGSNYDLTETREVKHTGDVTRVESNTGTETTVADETTKNTGGNTTETESAVINNTTEASRYGFNSSSAVPTDKSTNSNSGEGSSTTTIDQTTKNDSDITLTKDLTNNATDTYNTVDTETISRTGDLSVRAIQDTLQNDIDLWKRNVFYNIVMEDIISTLCLPVWETNE